MSVISALSEIFITKPKYQGKERRKFKLEEYLRREDLILVDHIPIFLATLGSAILGLAIPIMTLQVYDRILPNPEGGTLGILLSAVIVALVLDALLKISRSSLISRASSVFEHKMNVRVFDHALNSNFAAYQGYDPALQTQKLSVVKSVRDDYTGSSFAAMCENLLLPIYFGLIFYIGGNLGYVPMVIVLLYSMIALTTGRKLKKTSKVRDDYDELRYSFLVNVFNGIHTIKAFAHEKFFQRRYERHKEDVGATNFQVAQYSNILSNLGAISGGVMTVSVMTVGAMMVIDGQLTTGTLIASILLTGRVMQPVQKIISTIIRFDDAKLAKQDLSDIFRTPIVGSKQFAEPGDPILPDASEYPAAKGTLEVKNVSFKYAGTDKNVLEGLNLRVEPGETICLHSGFGSGKTTLVRLLCGNYEPQDGEVLIDGMTVTQYSQTELTKRIGLLETEPSIFRGTIRDNITRFGLAPENQAQEISAHLKLNKEIAKLPSGFETMVTGTKTDTLQPGLRQRIAIARVLASKPKIILFDQADKHLDPESYGTLFNFLGKIKGQATMILITNDENLSSLADTHYDLQHGKIIARK